MHDYIIKALAIVTSFCLATTIMAIKEYKSLKRNFNNGKHK